MTYLEMYNNSNNTIKYGQSGRNIETMYLKFAERSANIDRHAKGRWGQWNDNG